MLAGLVWRPRWGRYIGLVAAAVLAIVVVLSMVPRMASRYVDRFILGATDFETSVWWHTLNGGWQVAKDNLLLGIGTANYRMTPPEFFETIPHTNWQPHPHNYYLQLLTETGIIGLVLGMIFLWSIIWTCFRASFRNRDNVFIATAWVIPFGIFWPVATSADFFGQWNNIFIWSAVSIALCSSRKAVYAAGTREV